jgi:hypothetical protein
MLLPFSGQIRLAKSSQTGTDIGAEGGGVTGVLSKPTEAESISVHSGASPPRSHFHGKFENNLLGYTASLQIRQ